MKIKAPILEIPEDAPFKNDILEREPCANILTELIQSSVEPLVLCINARWGEGKTTFVKMWQQSLVRAGFNTIYFSAWENDFSKDALVSLIGEFDSSIQNLKTNAKGDARILDKKFDVAKKYGLSLLKNAVPAAVKAATLGLLDLDKAMEEALAKAAEGLAKDKIEQYEKAKTSVKGFKSALSELALELGKTDDPEKVLPLVIFVDELDRCRPDYAIDILEKVKHFFSVPNVVFVLAMDKYQLGCSIQTLYGAGIDVTGYLRRFIDIEYRLPAPDTEKFCRSQFSRYGFSEFFANRNSGLLREDRSNFERLFIGLFRALNCSLRDQEHCFSLLSLAIRTTRQNQLLYPSLLATLIVLKIKNSVLFGEFITGQRNVAAVMEYFGQTESGRLFLKQREAFVINAYLVLATTELHLIRDVGEQYARLAASSGDSVEQDRATVISQMLNQKAYDWNSKVLNYLVGKIELVSSFNR